MRQRAGETADRAHRPRVRSLIGVCAVSLLLLGLLAACSVQLMPQGGGSPQGGGVTIPVQVVVGQNGATVVLLPVTINGSGPYTFALDTGASTSLVDTPLAQKLNLQPVGTPAPISGIASTTPAQPIRIMHWHIEGLTLPADTAVAADLNGTQRGSGLQGLVGSDVWRMLGTVTINYNAQTLTVAHQGALAPAGAPLARSQGGATVGLVANRPSEAG
ncbi:MAG TPA: retropepsin-like aspartic protease [Ktedonobacterales bacterium]